RKWDEQEWTRKKDSKEPSYMDLIHSDVWKYYIMRHTTEMFRFKQCMRHPKLYNAIEWVVSRNIREQYPELSMTNAQIMYSYIISTSPHHIKWVRINKTAAKRLYCVTDTQLKEAGVNQIQTVKSPTYSLIYLFQCAFPRFKING